MSSGMALMYGAPPEPSQPREWPLIPDPDGLKEAIRKAADAAEAVKAAERRRVDHPPPYADDAEARVIATIAAFDDATRDRVLRYLVSRFGVKL